MNDFIGAIEFLCKAKAICEDAGDCRECLLRDKFCGQMTYEICDEADLVRKVMEYRLEDTDAKRN